MISTETEALGYKLAKEREEREKFFVPNETSTILTEEDDCKILIGSITTEKIFVDAVKIIGRDKQTIIAMEECSELIKVITKVKRHEINYNSLPDKLLFDLGKEIAHVLFMCNQLIIMYSVGEEVKIMYDKAMNYLENIIEGNKPDEKIYKKSL